MFGALDAIGKIMETNEEMAHRHPFSLTVAKSYPRSSDLEHDFQSALMAISCFVTPYCFRRFSCAHGEPKKIRRDSKFEEMSFCSEDIKPTKNTAGSGQCLVYSFGIYRSTDWETKVAKIFDCEVHAFDPTVEHENTTDVTFHSIGLQGEGTNMSSSHAVEYDAIDSNRLFSLGEIMKKLGHQNRTIDLLMMDCEGR
jgi:hypothetical protein